MNCPFCGAPQNDMRFTCGLPVAEYQRLHGRPEACKDRQIAQLQERLEAWREFGKNMRYVDRDSYGQFCTHAKKLKALGEWPDQGRGSDVSLS